MTKQEFDFALQESTERIGEEEGKLTPKQYAYLWLHTHYWTIENFDRSLNDREFALKYINIVAQHSLN